jgi:valyl-tRNA synthetase
VAVAGFDELPVDPTVRAPRAPCAKCGKSEWEPEKDVMDTWATSSETPQINARWGERDALPGLAPMSLRPQAHEIIRTWAFYTVVKSWLHHREVPWRDAMISGLVLDPERQKISKSKGNAPSNPSELIAQHGADAVRFWALSAKLGTDYPYNEEDLAAGRRLCVKLWNASKLVLGHLKDFDRPAWRSAPRAEPRAVDRGILLRLASTTADATVLLDAYEFGLAKQRVGEFFWGDFCDNWLEMAKDRLYDASPEKADLRRATQAVAYDVLYGVLRLLAPFVPHVVEAIHQAHFRATEGAISVTRAPWPPAVRPAGAEEAEAAWTLAVQSLQGVRRWRSERKVSPGKAIGAVRVTLSPDGAARFPSIEADLRAAGRVGRIEVAGGAPDLGEPLVEVLEPPAA